MCAWGEYLVMGVLFALRKSDASVASWTYICVVLTRGCLLTLQRVARGVFSPCFPVCRAGKFVPGQRRLQPGGKNGSDNTLRQFITPIFAVQYSSRGSSIPCPPPRSLLTQLPNLASLPVSLLAEQTQWQDEQNQFLAYDISPCFLCSIFLVGAIYSSTRARRSRVE
jgi:hypothetical protein